MSSLIRGRLAADPPGVAGAATPRSAATIRARGEVAQLVEHTTENRGVAGSIPALAIVVAARQHVAASSVDSLAGASFAPCVLATRACSQTRRGRGRGVRRLS